MCADSQKPATSSRGDRWEAVPHCFRHSPTFYRPLVVRDFRVFCHDIPHSSSRRWRREECQRTTIHRRTRADTRVSDSEAFLCGNNWVCVGRFPDLDRKSIRMCLRRRRIHVQPIPGECLDIFRVCCAMFQTFGPIHWWEPSRLLVSVCLLESEEVEVDALLWWARKRNRKREWWKLNSRWKFMHALFMRKHFGTLTSYWDPSNGYSRRWFIKKSVKKAEKRERKKMLWKLLIILFCSSSSLSIPLTCSSRKRQPAWVSHTSMARKITMMANWRGTHRGKWKWEWLSSMLCWLG